MKERTYENVIIRLTREAIGFVDEKRRETVRDEQACEQVQSVAFRNRPQHQE